MSYFPRSTFKYTTSNKTLTYEQRHFYEDNGFIVLRNLVDPEELDTYQKRFVDVCNGKVRSPEMIVMKDISLLKEGKAQGEFLIYKIQDLLFDDVFFGYASNKNVIDVVSSIVGDNITAINSMIINKPPGADKDSSRHPMHQDLYYFPIRPADKICAAWTAMERTDKQNGCLFVIPGSHQWELYPHVYPDGIVNKAFYGVQGFDHCDKVYLPMEKGDTVFFHPLILHGSGPNLSQGFRKIISVHYANSDCHFIDVSGTIQQTIQDEVNNSYKKKRGISFEQLLRLKSRIVVGRAGKYQEMKAKV